MSKEAMKLALEALEYIHEGANNQGSHTGISWRCVSNKAEPVITALREVLASEAKEQPAQQCSNALRIQGKAYPRTCKKCGLGPCVELAQQALDKMAENARKLGLDHEPAQDSGIVTAGGFDPRTQRTWVGLTPEQAVDLYKATETDNRMVLIDVVEAKLKELNT